MAGSRGAATSQLRRRQRLASTGAEPSRAVDSLAVRLQDLAYRSQAEYNLNVAAQTLGFAVQSEDRAVLDELVDYFGDGNRSAYLRATLKVMKSIMIADQLRGSQAYGQQRIAELGIEPADVPAQVQEFMKGSAQDRKK
jgi:hypothetical protein